MPRDTSHVSENPAGRIPIPRINLAHALTWAMVVARTTTSRGVNVAVTSGLKSGDRVATQGATLINQVR